MAEISSRRFEFEQAEKLYKRAIVLRERDSAVNTPEALALGLRDLGFLYSVHRDHKLADEYYQEALAVLRKNNLTTAGLYAEIYGDIGNEAKSRGQLQEAEKAYRQHLDLLAQTKVTDRSVAKKELAEVLVMLGRPGEAEPLYNSTVIDAAQLKKNIFVDSVLNAQRSTAALVYRNKFGGNVTDLSKVIENTKSRIDPNSIQYAAFLEDCAFAYPNFKIKAQPAIPLIEQAISIRKRLDPVNADRNPSIANDQFLIAHRLAVLGGYFITPALESYKIYKKLQENDDPSLKASQPAVLRLAYLLATGSASRTKAEEMANLAFHDTVLIHQFSVMKCMDWVSFMKTSESMQKL